MDETIEKNVLMQERYLSGLYDGMEQGIQEKQKDIVINMYKEKIALDVISKVTKLSTEEIDEIISQDK